MRTCLETVLESVSTGKHKKLDTTITEDTKLDDLLAILRFENYRFEQVPVSERYGLSKNLDWTAYVHFKVPEWDIVTLFFPQFTDAYKLCFDKKTGKLIEILRSQRMVNGRPQWEDCPMSLCLTNLNYWMEARKDLDR